MVTVVCWLIMIFACIRERKQLENQILGFTRFGSFTISCTMMVVLSSIKLSVIDCSVLWLTLVRCLVTWIVFKYKLEGNPHFSAIDIKQLEDSILLVFLPCFLLFSTNWRLDFFVTTPIAVITTFITTANAYSPEDGNLDCYT